MNAPRGRWLVLPLAMALAGCVSTAVAIVKAPFQVAGAGVDVASSGVDMMTTSQAEADRNRGRAIRKQEEAEAKAAKRAAAQKPGRVS